MIIINGYFCRNTQKVVMKKKSLCLIILILFIPLTICGEEDLSFESLQLKSSASKKAEDYYKLCEYCYEHDVELSSFAVCLDSMKYAALREKSVYYLAQYYNLHAEYAYALDSMKLYAENKKKAYLLFKGLHRSDLQADCCGELGYYYNIITSYDSARYYLREGIHLFERLDKNDTYLALLTNLASSYLYEGINDSALVQSQNALKWSEQMKDTVMQIENLNQLGVIYRKKNMPDQSILFYEKALHLCDLIGQKMRVPSLYFNIAILYAESDRLEEGLDFSRKALDYSLKIGDKNIIGASFMNLGSLLVKNKMYDNAIDTLRNAISIVSEVGNLRTLFLAYQNMTNAFYKSSRLDSAWAYQEKADKLAAKFDSEPQLFNYYQGKASLLNATGRYKEAIPIYHRLLQNYIDFPQDFRKFEAYNGLAVCYAQLGEFDKAYCYLDSAYISKDSVLTGERSKQMSDFMVKYQTKEKELEIAHLKEKQSRRLLYYIISWFVIVLFILYRAFRNKIKITRLSLLAKEKEKEFMVLQKETEVRLTQKYIDGLEAERKRLAQELHDGVCNNLFALEMNMNALTDSPDSLKESVAMLHQIREDVRGISHELMPPVFQYATIDEMLSDYISHLCRTASTEIQYYSTRTVDWGKLPQEVGYEVYRIVQETLNNSLKYADASLIEVSLVYKNNLLMITVSDDGKGFDLNKKNKGVGLRTIAERVKSIGGELSIKTGTTGTMVTVTIDMEKKYGGQVNDNIIGR